MFIYMDFKYKNLGTEKSYDFSADSNIDDIFLHNHEDIIKSLKKNTKKINNASNLLFQTYTNGGRIFFVGAGTSGRLGVVEAAEMPPTFGVNPNDFIGLIAGGNRALVKAVEGAEDQSKLAIQDLKKHNFKSRDLLIAISASGTSEYVLSAIRKTSKAKAKSIFLTCNKIKNKISDIDIVLNVGPEVIAGSTRLKSGTVTKIALNIITTSAMMKANHTLNGLMIDIKPTTKKLKARSVNNLSQLLNLPDSKCEKLLRNSNWNIRVAIIMSKMNLKYIEAKRISKKINIKDLLK